MINLVLVAVSGILTGLALNFPNLSFLAWFSIVPVIHVLSRTKLKGAVLAGIIFGFSFNLAVISWVGEVTRLGLPVLVLYLSLYSVLFFILGRYFLKKPLRLISLPAVWVLVEFLRENIWVGFSWTDLGYSQYLNTGFIQIADLLGVKFFSFLIVMVNVLIWEVFFSRKKHFFREVLFVSLLLSGCFGYSFWKINSQPQNKYLKVSLLQPDLPRKLKDDPSKLPEILDRLKALSLETEKESLVIFPEAAWPFTLDKDNSGYLDDFIKMIDRDVLIGTVARKDGLFFNRALLLNRQAEVLGSYDKLKLVPFGEYIPFREYLGFISVINSIGDITPGFELTKFSYKDSIFSVLICFEDVSSLYVVEMARDRDFLISITDDSWFGTSPEASQHLAIMTFRAIENNISIVRSANTGISGWVSNLGKIEKIEEAGRDILFPAAKTFEVSLTRKRSFYNKYPEFLVVFCVAFLLGLLLRKRPIVL